MRGVDHSRFEELRFEILNLAVERGEMRFKDAFKLARASYGPISTKTVSRFLHEMVNERYLEKAISDATKRATYKILQRGVEEYWVKQIIEEMHDGWVRVRSVMGYENEESPTENLIGRYEIVMKELQTFFLCFLPRIREIDEEQDRERALTMIANLNGKLFAELCKDLGRPLLYREDADEKIAERFEAIHSEYEALKRRFFHRHPEVVEKMLDIIKDADEQMGRIRNRLKSCI